MNYTSFLARASTAGRKTTRAIRKVPRITRFRPGGFAWQIKIVLIEKRRAPFLDQK